MGKWEPPERPEEEMTAQEREEAVLKIQERRKKQYELGRKLFIGMLIVWVASEVLGAVLGMFTFTKAADLGFYMLINLLGIILIFVLAYYLYHGRTGARIVFGILLALNILRNFLSMASASGAGITAAGVLAIAVSGLYFYIIFVCPPVREFLYGQSTE